MNASHCSTLKFNLEEIATLDAFQTGEKLR